ncbi:50S ribosomal protein L33 [Alkalihalophilus pseudofirmus]|nr:50S ribosomal protein L33 [Alkalihalobacterium alkalinitrilicum]OLO27189.1 50S ribosomal protein L33 [Alkalihalophilus pseudofirmus]
MRKKTVLACSECSSRNYTTEKNTQNQAIRIEMKKFCKTCKTHTLHQETK